jgi:hypothetical protein
MKPHSRLVFFTLVTLLVMVVNLAMPVSALADDGVPPETPTVDEAPPVEEPVSLPEVLEQAPPDTQVVVVNEAGEVEPLATVEAAGILATADPMWCPAGTTPGDAGCTGSYGDMASLVAALAADAALPTPLYGGQAGVIWVEDSYSGNDNAEINLNGTVLSTLSNHNLTIQGGWSGGNDTNITGTSLFDVALNIYNWVGNIALYDLDFAAANDTYASLAVDTTGNITVDDVTVTGNTTGTGASLDSCQYGGGLCAGTGNVTVTDSTFSGNNFIGLAVDSGGNTTLTNVTANSNLGPDGAFVIGEDDSAVTHDVTVTNSTFSGNVNGIGLEVIADGNVTLNNVTAGAVTAPVPLPGNNTGASIDTTFGMGNVTINGGQYNDNDWDGLDVWSGGDITVANADISDNSSPGLDTYGAYLDAIAGTGTISVSNSTLNNNDGYGLFGIAHGDVTLTNVDVDGGGITDDGALIKSIDGTATVNGGTFTDNTKTGLIAIGGLQVSLVNVNVTLNAGDGAQVYSTFTYACFGDMGIPVSVDGGTFTNNGINGLVVKPGPDGGTLVFVNPATFGGNGTGDYVLDLGNPCLGKDEEKPEEGKPVNIVEVPFKDGDPVEQDCDIYSGTALVLPDGTFVKFGCPFEGSVFLEGLLEEELPGPLGAGAEFVSAITYGMTDLEGLEVLVNPDGTITLKFKIPEDSNARAYDILYWDTSANNGAGAWVTLPQYKIGQPQAVALNPGDPEDGRLITRGVKQQGDFVTVTVNFTGTFVLVSR